MITPVVFFPFSHISQDQLAALQAFFSAFSFFPVAGNLNHHPSLQDLADKGAVLPILSSREDLASVDHSFEQYMAWARVNRGNEKNLRFLLKGNPYFTSDSDLTAIKSQIRGSGGTIEKPEQSRKDGLLRDLLFLRMAGQCDLENEIIDIRLKNIDKAGSRMLSDLLGEEDPMDMAPPVGKPGISDPGAVMTRERIEAWSRCMIHHEGFRSADANPLFVTTSEAVVDYLETISSDTINALDIDPIKVHENDCEKKTGWRQQVFEQLVCAAKEDTGRQKYPLEVKDECLLSGQIKLSLFSGNNIHELFDLKDEQIPVSVCLIRLK